MFHSTKKLLFIIWGRILGRITELFTLIKPTAIFVTYFFYKIHFFNVSKKFNHRRQKWLNNSVFLAKALLTSRLKKSGILSSRHFLNLSWASSLPCCFLNASSTISNSIMKLSIWNFEPIKSIVGTKSLTSDIWWKINSRSSPSPFLVHSSSSLNSLSLSKQSFVACESKNWSSSSLRIDSSLKHKMSFTKAFFNEFYTLTRTQKTRWLAHFLKPCYKVLPNADD